MRTTIVVRSKTLLTNHSNIPVNEEMLYMYRSNISVLHENIFAPHNNISYSADTVIYTVTKLRLISPQPSSWNNIITLKFSIYGASSKRVSEAKWFSSDTHLWTAWDYGRIYSSNIEAGWIEILQQTSCLYKLEPRVLIHYYKETRDERSEGLNN